MAITVGNITANTGNHTGGSGGTSEFSHNNDGDYLLVGVMQGFSDDAAEPSAVAFNGTAMTKIGDVAYGSGHAVSVWALVAPAAGAHNVTLTFTNQNVESVVAVSLNGVDQTTPTGTVVTTSGSSTTPSTTVTSASGELVVDFVASRQNNSATATVGSGQTERSNAVTSTGLPSLDVRGLVSTEAGAASVTMDWTLSASESWKAVAVPVKPAGTGTLKTQSVSGAITPTGTIPEMLVSLNSLAGALTPAGALTAQKVASLRTQSVAGSLTPTGAVVAQKVIASTVNLLMRLLQPRSE